MRVSAHEAVSEDGPHQGLSGVRLRQRPKLRGGHKHSDHRIRRVLAENVRRHRLRRHWSVETLSARTQLTPLFIEQIEQGSQGGLRLGTVERLARAFQVDIEVLLDPRADTRRTREVPFRAPKDRLRKRRAP
jgi:ribosome-binding protein aMBF1 (putative translation factor)